MVLERISQFKGIFTTVRCENVPVLKLLATTISVSAGVAR